MIEFVCNKEIKKIVFQYDVRIIINLKKNYEN